MREGNARELGRSQKRHLDSDLSCSLTMLFRIAATTGLPGFLCLQIMLSYRVPQQFTVRLMAFLVPALFLAVL